MTSLIVIHATTKPHPKYEDRGEVVNIQVERVKRRMNKIVIDVDLYKKRLTEFLKPLNIKGKTINKHIDDIILMFVDDPLHIDMHIDFFKGIIKGELGIHNNIELNKLIDKACKKLKDLLLTIRDYN